MAQVCIIDAAEYLKRMQRLLRQRVKVFKKLDKLPRLPEGATRELLSLLERKDLMYADEMGEVRESLDIACALLKPK